jgi:hypothetical protein
MPWLGFEPTIPAFERAKTVHALDRAATVRIYYSPNRRLPGSYSRSGQGAMHEIETQLTTLPTQISWFIDFLLPLHYSKIQP